MKKVAVSLIFLFFCVVGLIYAQDINIERDIIDKLDLPVYSLMGAPDNYSITIKYSIKDDCSDCVIDFFKAELAKQGWEVEGQEKYVDSYMDAYLKVKKQFAERVKKGVGLSGDEERASQYLLSTNDNEMKKKIKKFAPIALKANNKLHALSLYVSARLLPTNDIELVLTVSK